MEIFTKTNYSNKSNIIEKTKNSRKDLWVRTSKMDNKSSTCYIVSSSHYFKTSNTKDCSKNKENSTPVKYMLFGTIM